MMKKNNKLIRFFAIPLALAVLWLGLTFFYISTFESFSIVPFNHPEVLDNYIKKPLLENQKITGEFVASENNLGIVAMRFQLRSRIPFAQEDNLVFRLKEKGDKDWYYTGEYKSGLTYDVPFLPFGFPIIAESRGKVYQFELESLKGNPKNALILSRQYPQLQSKYVADLGVIKADPIEAIEYFRQKYIGSFDNPSVVFSAVVYALPLLFYLAFISGLIDKLIKRFPQQFRWIEERFKLLKSNDSALFFLSILLVFIVLDIFLIQILNDSIYIVVVVMWLIICSVLKEKERLTFVVGLSLLATTVISNTSGHEAIAEKSAAWAFMFFVTGTVQIMIELRKDMKSSKS